MTTVQWGLLVLDIVAAAGPVSAVRVGWLAFVAFAGIVGAVATGPEWWRWLRSPEPQEPHR